MITALPRAGYIIEDLSNEDIQDIFSARFDIEGLVVKRAAQYITPEELQMLRDNIDQAKAHIQSGELEKVTQLDLEFHGIIYRASRSKTLFRICKNLGELTMKYRHGLNLDRNLWDIAIENHETIYQALVSKDEAQAVKAIVAHGEQARAQLLAMMKKVRSESFLEDTL